MNDSVDLHGMDFSVYVRIARLALTQKGVAYRLVPLNPFADDPPDPNRNLHPFGKMPVLMHGGTRIIETQTIVRYVDEGFTGPALQPSGAVDRARQNQIVGICDSYLYKALVWGVFVEVLRKPAEGGVTDPSVVTEALKMTDTAFSVIEVLLAEEPGDAPDLADLFLMPILDYGLRVAAAAACARKYSRLCRRWSWMQGQASFMATEPLEFISLLPQHSLR